MPRTPFRRFKNKRRPNPPRRQRQPRRGGRSGVNTAIIRVPRGLHSPLPMRLETTFTASGYFSLASATAAYTIPIKIGSPRLPFASAGPTGVTWNNLTPGTFQPPGFGILVTSNTYVVGMVKSVLIEFDACPQTVQDSIVVTGTPSNSNSVPASVGAALTRPWTKQQNFASGRTYRLGDYSWRHNIQLHNFYGIPRLLYDNDLSGQWNFSPSTDPTFMTWYVMQFETGDAAVLADAMECRIRLTYRVLLKGLATESLTLDALSLSETKHPDVVVVPSGTCSTL